MRYIKVLLLVLLIFFSLVFFFQNQTALSTAMTLKLNLFFVPEMTSIPLPFYFIVIVPSSWVPCWQWPCCCGTRCT